jgi:hypothetical protein
MAIVTADEGFRSFGLPVYQDGSDHGSELFLKLVTKFKGNNSVSNITKHLFGEFDKLTAEEKSSFGWLEGKPVSSIFGYYHNDGRFNGRKNGVSTESRQSCKLIKLLRLTF